MPWVKTYEHSNSKPIYFVWLIIRLKAFKRAFFMPINRAVLSASDATCNDVILRRYA